MKYIFLTQQFYIDYKNCTEIEQKQDRPYVQVYVKVNSIDFAIPMRSDIKHSYAFWTDKPNRCGVDYSKAVVIEDKKYIDTTRKPYIRPNEFKALIGKSFNIEQGLLNYIEEYKKAKLNQNIYRNKLLCQYSTLQYFEKYIVN